MRGILFAIIWFAIFGAIWTTRAAEEHFHPPQDAELHTKFYAGWLMPNGGAQRVLSCCNIHDCYPTAFKNVGGTWFARRREDGAWMPVPEGKLENMQPDPRESPDGQGHVCAAPPTQPGHFAVYCAVLGAAGI